MQTAVATSAARPASPHRAHLVGLSPMQGLMLERVRGLDKQGEGCWAHLETLAKGKDDADWKVSKKVARRLLRELRELGRIVVAGVRRVTWSLVYLIPGRSYRAESLNLCPKATAGLFATAARYVERAPEKRRERAARGWAAEAARVLLLAPDAPGTPADGAVAATQINGVHISAHLHRTYCRAVLLEAVRQMQEYELRLLRTTGAGLRSRAGFLTKKCAELAAQRRDQRKAAQVQAARAQPAAADLEPMTAEQSAMAEAAQRALGQGKLADMLLGPSPITFPAEGSTGAVVRQGSPPAGVEAGPLLIELVECWVRTKRLDTRQATQQYYSDRLKLLKERLGDMRAAAWCHARIVEYIEQRKGVELTTVKRELDMIKGALVLQRMQEDASSLRDPRDYWIKLRVPKPQKDRYLKRSELALLDGKLSKRNHRDWLLWAVYTGARKGELIGLCWEDLDLENGRLHIRGTKTPKADRWIPLHPKLIKWVVAKTSTRPQRGRILDRWHNVWRDLGEACDRAEIPRVSMNDLRRTFCSWMLQKGVPIAVVADLMGHVDTTMVSRVYGKLETAQRRDAISAL